MSDEAKWYVVHTYSGYENKVASNLEKTVENHSLQNLIFEIRVPTEKVTEVAANGKTKEVERKIFPGYVIVKMILTDESWYAVRNIRGCTGFVGPSSKPIPLTDEEVERLGVETRNVEVSYNVGDSVQITDGPLEGFIGTVEEIDVDKNHIRVMVSSTTNFGGANKWLRRLRALLSSRYLPVKLPRHHRLVRLSVSTVLTSWHLQRNLTSAPRATLVLSSRSSSQYTQTVPLPL